MSTGYGTNIWEVDIPDDVVPENLAPTNRKLLIGLAALSAVGLLASWLLAIDGWRALREPNATLMCAFDAALDCAPAMDLWQARLFGFPNAYLGIAAFAIALTATIAQLAGVTARWFQIGLLIGTIFGQLLIFFLMFTTFTQLNALCPWCTVIWLIIWPLLWLQIVELARPHRNLGNILTNYRWPILIAGYLVAAIIGFLTLGTRVLGA